MILISKDIQEKIKKIYLDILNRDADLEGLEYWSKMLQENTMSLEEIKNNFYASSTSCR